MTATVWLAIGLGLLGLVGYRTGRVWLDAGPLAAGVGWRIHWTLVGALFPSRYWWGARIEALSTEDREDLLAGETAALDLGRADSARCPLCRAEIPRAWALTGTGQAGSATAAVAAGPVQCPACDFRLDACRHCAHFLPGGLTSWSGWMREGSDSSTGRCAHYQSVQPVEEACAPPMARQLRRRGYDSIRAPLQIVDGYLPPDFCRAFQADRRRLRASGLRWPDAHRRALLHLLSASPERPNGRADGSENEGKLPAAGEEWLL